MGVEVVGGGNKARAEGAVRFASEFVAETETVIDLEALIVVGIENVGLRGVGPIGGSGSPTGVTSCLIQAPEEARHETAGPGGARFVIPYACGVRVIRKARKGTQVGISEGR